MRTARVSHNLVAARRVTDHRNFFKVELVKQFSNALPCQEGLPSHCA